MTESKPIDTSEIAEGGDTEDRATEDRANEGVASKHPPTLRLGWIVLAFALFVATLSQLFAPSFDHQNANLMGLAVLAIAILYFLFCLHRVQRFRGRPWRVPLGATVALVAFLVAFRFDGFSGEMLPLFRWRFEDSRKHELKSVASGDGALIDSRIEESSATSRVSGDSPQFLGPARNAVLSERHFSIPQDVSDVRVVWDHGIGEGWSSFAVAGNHAVTLEQREHDECLTCYRLSDGELVWIRRHTGRHENPLGGVGPRSTPTIVGQRVFAATATGLVWCVDLASGDVQWEVDLFDLAGWTQPEFELAAPWGYAGSPLVIENVCVLPLGGPVGSDRSASLVALDVNDGGVVWKAGDDQLSYASPIEASLDGQRQIVSVNEKTVSGHDLVDGTVLWEFDWPGSTNTGANCSSAVVVGENRLLVGKGYGGGSALVEVRNENGWTTRDLWRSSRVLKTKFNHACVDGDTAYAISNGSLQAVDLTDGTEYWRQPRRNRSAQGQALLADDTLVVQNEAGDVIFVEATTEGYNERFRIDALSSKTWNIPTIAGRYLLVRNDRQAICFELPSN